MAGRLKWWFILGAVALLAGCGGSGGAGSSSGAAHTVQMGGAIQGSPLVVTTVTTLAGTPSTANGVGGAAAFNEPVHVASDGTSLYVTDEHSFTIRKIDIATGTVSTFAGSPGISGTADGVGTGARFSDPDGITTDGSNLFITEYNKNTVRKIAISTRAVTTLAGSAGVTGSRDGTGNGATFNHPRGIATDGTSLYVTDGGNNAIRKIEISTGAVTTLAGTAGSTGRTDGIGIEARFNFPCGIATDGANLYVADQNNHTIRKVLIATREVTTLAGSGVSGSVDGTGPDASFNFPTGICSDGANLYIADSNNNTMRKMVIATGTVTTLAGTAGVCGGADGTGSAASFSSPVGVAINGEDLYVVNTGNNTIRKVATTTGAVTTVAGTPASTDGMGAAAKFYYPIGIATDGGNLYVSDQINRTVRKVSISTGAVTTLAGSAGVTGVADGVGSAARFRGPDALTADGTNLYLCDYGANTIRKIAIATGEVTTIAGNAGITGSADGIGVSATFNHPRGITTDGKNLYIADGDNNTIRRLTIATGQVTTIAGTPGTVGSMDGAGSSVRFNVPSQMTTDGVNLYLVDLGNSTIRKIVIASGEVSTIAGSAASRGHVDGTGSAARFYYPRAITTDGTNLYVSDGGNRTIRKIDLASGAVSTIAGTTSVEGARDGGAASATFFFPYGLTTDGTSLYILDAGNNTIRKLGT